MNQSELQIEFWNAVWVKILVALIDIGMIFSAIFFPMTSISNIELYANSFDNLQMLPLIPSFLFVIFYVVLMLSIKTYTADDKKFLWQLSYSFSLLSASILSIHYYIQLTIVRQGLLNNELSGLWQLSAPNPHSFFWVLSALGYGMMGVSFLFAFPIFDNASEKGIKWLFIINGVDGVVFLVGNMLGIFIINIIASFIWGIFFLITTAIMAIHFHKIYSNSVK